MKRFLCLGLAVSTLGLMTGSLLGAPAPHADKANWDNLKQLQAGQKIEVIDMKRKSLKGTFVGVSEEAISLRTPEGEISVERANVLRITNREESKRLRNALIGMAIGVGPGTAFGVLGAGLVANEGGSIAAPLVRQYWASSNRSLM